MYLNNRFYSVTPFYLIGVKHMRIDKYLSNANLGSRSEIKKLIKDKRVRLNGQIVKNGKENLDINHDIVEVNQHKIELFENVYLMLNKPQGVITATTDSSQKTVLDLIQPQDRFKGLSPVGRLDKDTTGLLILTTDGQLNHNLLAPNKHITKIYSATIQGIVTDKEINRFEQGLVLKNGTTFKPAKLEVGSIDTDQNQSQITVSISEGKYHQIKRMFKACGMTVLTLERLQMGPLKLDSTLKPGKYRKLSPNELNLLK